MKNKKRKVITIGIVTTLISMSFLFSGVSLAAYLNKMEFKNSVQATAIPGKFASGSGTLLDPYIINNSDHLRNLQQLVMLDNFDENDHFAINSSFIWEGEPLRPIGTEDHPFNSQFDGRCNIITNLVVEGRDTNDIGMFGYTGINSRVKNIILTHPTINVLTNTHPENGSLESTNILANDTKLNEDAAKLNLTCTDNTITLPTTKTIKYKENDLTIKYESSDIDVLNIKKGTDTYTLNSETLPNESKVHMGLYTIQVVAKIEFIDVVTNKKYSYTLERWNIELKVDVSNGTISINKRKNENGEYVLNVYKNIHTGTPHGINVGFFIGHCDGGASYLGVYGGLSKDPNANGIIYLNGRKAKSTSSLIGRERIDNPLDTTAKNKFNKLFDFGEYPINLDGEYVKSDSELDTGLIIPSINASLDEKALYRSNPFDTPRDITNKEIITRQNNRSVAITDTLFGETLNYDDATMQTSEFARYYPKAIENDLTGESSIVNISVDGDSSVKRNAIRIDSGLRTGAYISPRNGFHVIFGSDMVMVKNGVKDCDFYVENGIWIYATKELKGNFLELLFSQKDGFIADIDIKYIVNKKKPETPENPKTPDDSNNICNNEFIIKKNQYKRNRTGKALIGSYKTSDIGQLVWDNVPVISQADGTPTITKIKLDNENYGEVLERNIRFEAKTKPSVNDYISPIFTLGIGDPTQNPVERTNSDGGRNQLNYAGGVFTDEGGYNAGSVATYNSNGEVNGYTQDYEKRFYFDEKQEWDNNCDSVDILDIDVSFTTKDGNTSSLTNNVDFISDTTKQTYELPIKQEDGTISPSTVSGWEKESKTRILFDLNSENNLQAKNMYYRDEDNFLGGASLYLYYNSPNTSYNPQNTPRYARATITKDSNITY